MRIRQILVQARAAGVDRLDAQLLVAHVAGQPRTWVIAHDDSTLTSAQGQALEALLLRRAAGEPLAYLVGEREFCGLNLRVTPDVLIPRPDTETLVEWALERLSQVATPRVLDLGTGSGAIALAIKHACERAEVHATDISEGALSVARGNGQRLGLDVHWHLGSWWAAAPPAIFDLVVSNPPYVARGDPHLQALRHEPALALTPADDPGDGLAAVAQIVGAAQPWLAPGSWLLIEHGAGQAGATQTHLAAQGFRDIATRRDLAGRPRVTGGRRSA